jgi:hypothetical protein
MQRYDFGFKVRPTLRLSRVEEILRTTRIIEPLPSRRTLINLITEGIIEGKQTSFGYVVYEDSFKSWVHQYHESNLGMVT